MVSEMDFSIEIKINGKEFDSYYRDSFKVQVNKTDLDAKQLASFVPRILANNVSPLSKALAGNTSSN